MCCHHNSKQILSHNIISWRKLKNLTQEKLAERAGLSTRTINKVENMEVDIKGSTVCMIAKGLGVDPGSLWELDGFGFAHNQPAPAIDFSAELAVLAISAAETRSHKLTPTTEMVTGRIYEKMDAYAQQLSLEMDCLTLDQQRALSLILCVYRDLKSPDESPPYDRVAYRMISGSFVSDEGHSYTGYGMSVYKLDGELEHMQLMMEAKDISTNRLFVEDLVERFNRGKVSPEHFWEILEDLM